MHGNFCIIRKFLYLSSFLLNIYVSHRIENVFKKDYSMFLSGCQQKIRIFSLLFLHIRRWYGKSDLFRMLISFLYFQFFPCYNRFVCAIILLM